MSLGGAFLVVFWGGCMMKQASVSQELFHAMRGTTGLGGLEYLSCVVALGLFLMFGRNAIQGQLGSRGGTGPGPSP